MYIREENSLETTVNKTGLKNKRRESHKHIHDKTTKILGLNYQNTEINTQTYLLRIEQLLRKSSGEKYHVYKANQPCKNIDEVKTKKLPFFYEDGVR